MLLDPLWDLAPLVSPGVPLVSKDLRGGGTCSTPKNPNPNGDSMVMLGVGLRVFGVFGVLRG